MIHLILGGARSGKSRLAEGYCQQALVAGEADRLVYVATAEALDEEMKARIDHHRESRGPGWEVVEEPLAIASVLGACRAGDWVLVDCLTLWVSNGLCFHGLEEYNRQRELLLAVLEETEATIVLVSNEVGGGIVPVGELSRSFVDEAGRLHQQIAAVADRVDYVVAGLTQRLK